ncbi:hypothetical protein D3C83_51630 [compost metagenome]
MLIVGAAVALQRQQMLGDEGAIALAVAFDVGGKGKVHKNSGRFALSCVNLRRRRMLRIVIPVKTGIQKTTGFRIKSGMTALYFPDRVRNDGAFLSGSCPA